MATFNSDATAMASPSTTGPVAPYKQSCSRTQSMSSDRPSTIAHSLMSAPLSVSPEAAFVAASAASQIVTNDHDAHSETWYDQVGIEPSGETALVSTGALQLANNFIDHLLFNIIGTAKSTRLADLRTAVGEVLKPKLAQDAINNADEELREYLGGGDIEDLEPQPGAVSPRDWDLELAWKRTRLRCMVYSSLGDMEEEDEDYYMEQEHLRSDGDDIASETVSPAVAIFLTSILEFMGEQVLVVSGQAAFNRLRLKYEKELRDGSRSPSEIADRIIVDELDMERVALDRTFGRLWRAWKKRIRSPTEQNFSRPFSRNSFSMAHTRQDSNATDNYTTPTPMSAEAVPTPPEAEKTIADTPETQVALALEPSEVQLPISPRDVDEIEVPGLVCYSDDEVSDDEGYEFVQTPRPASMIIWPARTRAGQDAEVGIEAAGENASGDVAKPALHDATTESEMSSQQSPPVLQTAGLATAPRHSRPRARSQPGAARHRLVSPVPATTTSTDATKTQDLDTSDREQVAPMGEPTTEETTGEESTVGAGIPAAIGTGIAAATAAIGGLVAAAAAGASGLSRTDSTRSGTEVPDELDEEPQIMTSSRISVYGAPEGVVPSPGIPVRSNSIRSARIIDVPSRSPTTRSRNSSVDTIERSTSRGPHPAATSASFRNPRMPTPPIAEEVSRYDIGPSPVDPRDITHLAAPPKRNRPTAVTGSPSPAPHPAPIKTTMSSNLSADQDVRSASSQNARRSPLPTLPERNASRPNYPGPPSKSSPESPKFPRQVSTESPPSASNKFWTVRSAEETAASNSVAPARAHDVARDFEELIHSDQTLQYTLTPENMRDISVRKLFRGFGLVHTILMIFIGLKHRCQHGHGP